MYTQSPIWRVFVSSGKQVSIVQIDRVINTENINLIINEMKKEKYGNNDDYDVDGENDDNFREKISRGAFCT